MRRPPLILHASAAALAATLLAGWVTTFEPDRAARAPELDGFGTLHMVITTQVPAAQQLFSRSLLQAYAFNDLEAARAFKAALALDPACAMCAWGVAYVLGPNINAVQRGDLSEARRYVARAQRVDGISPRERALIEAMAARYGDADDAVSKSAPPSAPICGSGATAKAHPLDVEYANRMRAIVETYPDDPDVTTLYAEALMIATRVDWWDRKTGAAAPGIAEMTARLERALAKSPDHTGLNHYLIHAADSSPAPQRAALAADRLGQLAPEAPHLLHMPAHVYVRVGRYGDAVRVNVDALAAEVRQTKKLETQGFGPSGNWDGHNLHFLWFAALMDGRGDGALEQARRLAQRSADRKTATAEFMRGLPLLTLVRLERWSAVLAEPAPGGAAGIAPALSHYARGIALLRQGRRSDAEAEAAALRSALEAPVLAGKTLMGDDTARDVLGILSAQLEAAIAAADARPDAARASLERAIEKEAALEASEPPLLGAASRLALGDAMLRAGRWSEAEAAFRADLADQPGNGWALRGLQRALAAQGKADAAQSVQVELARVWSAADASLLRSAPL